MTQREIVNLRDKVIENINYLSDEYKMIYDILNDLNRLINLDMEHSFILQWWVENEESIEEINKLIEKRNQDR